MPEGVDLYTIDADHKEYKILEIESVSPRNCVCILEENCLINSSPWHIRRKGEF